MKKRLNTDAITNELRGASHFFPRRENQDRSTEAPLPAPAPRHVAPGTQALRSPDAQAPGHSGTETSGRLGVQASRPLDTQLDLSAKAESRQTLRLTEGEFRRLAILQATLSEQLDVTRVEKNDILRAALHRMLEEFQERGMESDLVKRLRRKYR